MCPLMRVLNHSFARFPGYAFPLAFAAYPTCVTLPSHTSHQKQPSNVTHALIRSYGIAVLMIVCAFEGAGSTNT